MTPIYLDCKRCEECDLCPAPYFDCNVLQKILCTYVLGGFIKEVLDYYKCMSMFKLCGPNEALWYLYLSYRDSFGVEARIVYTVGAEPLSFFVLL